MRNSSKNEGTDESRDIILVDFQKLLGRVISYWWLFLISVILAITLSQLYLRYATFEYSARAILLIKDAGTSGNISEQSILVADQVLTGGGKAMDNEIQILKSLTLMEKVVDRLGLDVAYFRQGNLKESELYKATSVVLDTFVLLENSLFGAELFLQQKDYETFLFKEDKEAEWSGPFHYGVPFEVETGKFTFSLSPVNAVVPGDYRILITSVEYAARNYKSRLEVQRIGDHSASSVLDLSILDPVPEKASDILNTLIDIYNEEEINDENKVLRSTLKFIDHRVTSLVNELDSVEGRIQQYKSANEIISDNAASSMNYTLSEVRAAVQQLSAYEVQEKLLQSLESFLAKDRLTYELIPANLISETPILTNLVNQYNSLVLKYKQIIVTASDQNPVRMSLEEQLVDIQRLILETIQNLQKDLQIPIRQIEQNIKELRSNMGNIPGIEKRLIEKMRTQAVKENLFLYLLQKREETALSEAITTAKTRTIDRARISKAPVYPKRKFIRVISVVLGLFLPLIFIILLGLFETKIDSEETIKQLTDIPILGRIAFKKGGKHIIVKQGNRSAINEMFRLLRTNLNFINHGKDQQTIMVTSSVSGEGKTFIALNLGITLALSNKKVVLLGLDLRKPKLATYMGSTQSKGITNFLIGQNNVDDIIQDFEGNENLSFITSGPTPPNPAELILSDRMGELLKILAERFDYILIDTPPVGLVSDALLLREYVDNTLIVVHHQMTKKVMIKNLENMFAQKELKNPSIIYNGVKFGKSYYGYGGYHYGYNHEYYVEEDDDEK